MSQLIIRRGHAYRDKLRDYKVLVDGEVVGKVSDGGEFTHELTAGEHKVQCKVDWCSSPEPIVTVPEEGSLNMTVAPNGGALTAGIQALLEPKNYLKLTVDA